MWRGRLSRTREGPDRGLPELLIVNQVAGPLMEKLIENLSAGGVRCTLLTGGLER